MRRISARRCAPRQRVIQCGLEMTLPARGASAELRFSERQSKSELTRAKRDLWPRRRSAHVKEPPPMPVEIDEAVRVHEAEILRLVVGRASRSDGLGDDFVDFL